MHSPVIDLQGINKSFRLYSRNRDRLFEILFPFKGNRHQDFFALKDINFSLQKGESLGIVGENGSGKSTLLKIVSGVLTPTSGTISVTGSLGCLLELGGGFNPELSGIENAKLQLLMSSTLGDTNALLDAIIEFAEVGDFIHHPVKKYSSGMFMRLAFACATAINPAILIVDEELAVGDVFFVKKCMNRMHQLLQNDTTLLFVSHDLEAVRRLCSKALWLNKGEQMAFGPTKDVAERYTEYTRKRESLRHEEQGGGYAHGVHASAKSVPMLHRVQGAIDMAEQRLFVGGAWDWQDEGPIRFRMASTPEAAAAFELAGERLTLTFMRGDGFTMPEVLLDGKEVILTIDNNESYPILSQAPAQTHNFTLLLAPGEHTVCIRPTKEGRVGWLGGCVDQSPANLTFSDNPELAALWKEKSHCWGDGRAHICNVELLDATTLSPVTHVTPEQYVRLRIHAKRVGVINGQVTLAFKVENRLSVCMFGTSTLEEFYVFDAGAAAWVAEFLFCLPLKSGDYLISVAVVSKDCGTYAVHNNIDPATNIFVRAEHQRSIWGEFYNPTQVSVSQIFNKSF